MVSTRRKHYTPPIRPFPRSILQTLIGFSRTQSLKSPLLKSLYCLLLHLSSRTTLCCPNSEVPVQTIDVKCRQYRHKINFKDICDLSDILFKELEKGFKQLSSALHDVSANWAKGQPGLHSDILETFEELILILRCCMVILDLLVSDQNLHFEKCKVLFTILRICSRVAGDMEQNAMSFNKSVSRDCTYVDNGCTTSITEEYFTSLSFIEFSDSQLPFLSAVLQVYADELLAHESLRKYFFLINSISSTSEMLFIYRPPSQNFMETVLEVTAVHFLTSLSNEQAFENFRNKLFYQHYTDCRNQELSLSTSLYLLLNPVMLSAPNFLQAHVISLVSEAIDTDMASQIQGPDHKLMDYYLSAFEKSATLYTRTMPCLQRNDHSVGTHNSSVESCSKGRRLQQSFESYIRPVTRTKISHLITKYESLWHSREFNKYCKTKAEFVSDAIDFVKESQDILDESGKREVISILQVIILKAFEDDTLLQTIGETSVHDLCLLASILKLLSSSLLQVLLSMTRSGTIKDLSLCREYVTLVSIIANCFKQFKVNIPIQRILSDAMESHPMRHKESKLMLFHFSALLSLTSVCGFDCLLKGCIYAIMLVMKLFMVEEGNVGAVLSLLDSESKSKSSLSLPENIQEVQMNQESSQILASKFQKIRTAYLRSDSLANEHTGNQEERAETLANNLTQKKIPGMVEQTVETSSGKMFLKCRFQLQGKTEPSDIDELADFVVGEEGKDYGAWLRSRKKYRKFKSEKMAVLSWKKKKQTWKQFGGKVS